MDSQTEILAAFLSDLRLEDIPEQVRHEAKRLILDTLGCMIAGARSELGHVARQVAGLFGTSSAAFIAGREERGGLVEAAYSNARTANALDLDETFPVGAHFGAGAVAAALAVTEAEHGSGENLLLAVIAGYELGGRVASLLGPVTSVEDGRVTGFPPVWGVAAPVVLAAAGAAAKAQGYDAVLFRQAIGLAASNAPLPAGAHWSAAVDLPNCKYCDAGWCTVTGLVSALSARLGSTGFDCILDGASGLARMCGVEVARHDLLCADLGMRWMLQDVSYKPWPTCRFTHYSLTALERLLSSSAIEIADIEEIVVETGPLACSERFTNPHPRTFASRQFSYPHMVALMLLGVPPGEQWSDEIIAAAPHVVALRDRVRVVSHPRGDSFARAFERNQIRTMPGGIEVRTRSGALRAETEFAKGDPWSPATRLSDGDLVAKLEGLLPAGRVAPLVEAVFNLERASSPTELVRALQAAQGA